MQTTKAYRPATAAIEPQTAAEFVQAPKERRPWQSIANYIQAKQIVLSIYVLIQVWVVFATYKIINIYEYVYNYYWS